MDRFKPKVDPNIYISECGYEFYTGNAQNAKQVCVRAVELKSVTLTENDMKEMLRRMGR